MATRPENDLEAIYKCRLDVDKKSCEKSPLWMLLGLNPSGSPSDVAPETYRDGASFEIRVGQAISWNPPEHVVGSKYAVTPNLPTGLGLNEDSGVISGTPTTVASSASYTITQTKPDTSTTTYTLAIAITGASSGESGTGGNETGGNTGGGTPEKTNPVQFTPNMGRYFYLPSEEITLTSGTPGAVIHYTLDGTEPTTSSPVYTAPLGKIWSFAGVDIKAMAVKSGLANSDVYKAEYQIIPLRTGQTSASYAPNDNVSYTMGATRGYTDNGDGTILDTATNLTWQKCSRGQNNDGTCSGSATTANWTDANSYCNSLSLAGKTWRLPTRLELETLVDHGQNAPAIHGTYFPGTPAHEFWTSSRFMTTSSAWYVHFTYGNTDRISDTNSYRVRCVSGRSRDHKNRFILREDGDIYDMSTGIVWKKCNEGESGSNCIGTATTYTWEQAVTACGTYSLPTANALRSLAEADMSVFPTQSGNYWSVTAHSVSPGTHAWFADTLTGSIAVTAKTNTYKVRCMTLTK